MRARSGGVRDIGVKHITAFVGAIRSGDFNKTEVNVEEGSFDRSTSDRFHFYSIYGHSFC